ncbi:hypothetical protein DAPPUDRAFT_245546 [Daphnia pulex]|uniref:Uncharacterized protein n=1 Tax=Daphnia pulex TaxID=6669 RepID=E9GNK4_DAPPU|nr:hypothetical protein DAPPUDRAFT_245546 [Daphnia pulex]|eukprot:EFX78784.1 hypothetical protein DAPPUDRAFT_245546 [Daphnia pulex]
MEHAQTCPNKSPPDVVAVMTQSLMTQQPASPPDVYSIALMTKSSIRHNQKVRNVADGPVCLITPPMSPFLYCLGALRALVIVIVTASGRDCHVTVGTRKSTHVNSSVPFQIATRSSTRTAATPLTPARVVVPTTQVSSPSLRGRAGRLTYNLPVSATAASRVPEMALPQDLIDALTNLATAMGQDRAAAQTQSTALLNALNMQRLQSLNLVQQLANNAAAPAAAVARVTAAAVDSIPCFEAVAEGWTDAQRIQVAARRLLKTQNGSAENKEKNVYPSKSDGFVKNTWEEIHGDVLPEEKLSR